MRKEDILILKLYGGLGIVAVMGTYYKKECHNNPKTFAKSNLE